MKEPNEWWIWRYRLSTKERAKEKDVLVKGQSWNEKGYQGGKGGNDADTWNHPNHQMSH